MRTKNLIELVPPLGVRGLFILMKKLIWHLARAVGLSICLSGSLFAQNINRVEYFVDADPGFGNGTAITFTASSTINETFAVPLATVGDGFHFVSVRAKDDVNKWSTVVVRPFFKERIFGASTPFGVVTAMEYFIDNDPGFGNGTAVTFTAATTTNDFTFVAPLTATSDGLHWLSVRAKDNANRWSTVVVRPFFKEIVPVSVALRNITNIEYFIDTDPGFGLGTAVSFTPNTTLSNLAIMANLTGVSNGSHRIFIRAKDANNKWSTVGTKNFTVCASPVNASITAGGSTTLCSGQNVVLSVPAGNTYQWYQNGNILSGQTAATYTATSAGSFHVVATSGGCSSVINPVEVKLNSNSAPTISTNTATICNGSQAVLVASGCDDGVVNWSNAMTGSPLVFTPSATANYTATCTRGLCPASSASSAVTITVSNTPAAISVNGVPASAVCPGTSVVLTASSCSGGVRTWNTGVTGGTITVAPTVTTTYTVTCTSGTCTSKGTGTITIVSPSPTQMYVVTPNQTVCSGTSINLSASNCTGGTILWSNGIAGSSQTVILTATTTYSATCTIGSCTSAGLNAAQIVVLNPPNAPTVTTPSQTVCRGTVITLTAINCVNDVIWSDGSIGISVNVTPESTTTYTAACRFDDCPTAASNATTITVTDCPNSSVLITRVEYFIDNDPGFGLGTLVTTGFTAAPLVNNLAISIPITSVSNGMHWISVRARDANNKWSTVAVRPFLKETIPVTILPPNLTKIEYFFDLDPGFGLGTDVPIMAATTLTDFAFTSPISNALSNGIHWLSVRARDANNKWSTVTVRPFLKEAIPVTILPPNLTKIEYFFDLDPGFGLGTDVPIMAATTLTDFAFTSPISNALSNGIHWLSVRARDANNKWSTVTVRPFLKEATPTATVISNIVALEYFINLDPGVGLGTSIPFTAAPTLTNIMASVNLEDLNLGINRLFIRAKNANNVWGVVGQIDFNIQDEIALVANGTPVAFCRATVFNIPYTISGTYNAGNVFTAQLSNSAGSFSSPTTIGSVTSTTAGTIAATIPNGTTVGTGYKVRLISSNPSITNNPSKPFEVLSVCPPPCAGLLTLSSTNNPTDDVSSGVILKEANALIGIITASNKITGTAIVTFKAGKSITLGPGFKADNGVVFKTEFGGCN